MIPSPGNLPYEFRDTTLKDVADNWRKEFEAEVKDNNFLRGGKSLMLLGAGAEHASRQWLACLLRANFRAYRATPFEIVRRVSGLPVPWDDETKKAMFEEAECILIDDFFFDHDDGLSAGDAYRLWWFMLEAVRDGAVLVVASNNEKIDTINCYPDYVWEFVEETFEVIRGSKTEKTSGGIKKRVKADR